MPHKKPFVFKPLAGTDTRLGQLQEWADYYGVELKWGDKEISVGGSRSWTSYPIIQGHGYPQFTGEGSKQRQAQGKAAEMIYASTGTLDKAKDKAPVTAVHIAPAHL